MEDRKVVFLAEDDEDDQLLFKEAFEELKLPHELVICPDGVALVDSVLKRRPERIATIFLDLNMPRMNGVQCMEELSGMAGYRAIKRIVMSTSLPPSGELGSEANSDHLFVLKPAHFGELKSLIARALQ